MQQSFNATIPEYSILPCADLLSCQKLSTPVVFLADIIENLFHVKDIVKMFCLVQARFLSLYELEKKVWNRSIHFLFVVIFRLSNGLICESEIALLFSICYFVLKSGFEICGVY